MRKKIFLDYIVVKLENSNKIGGKKRGIFIW